MSEQPSLDAWYRQHQGRGEDHPDVRVWYPHGSIYSTLQTITVGSGDEREDVLPTGAVHANLHMVGLSIGGTLDDLELMLAAATEAVAASRAYANKLAATPEPEEDE